MNNTTTFAGASFRSYVGSRSGVDVLAGKSIRQDPTSGFDCFEDYFTEAEAEADEIQKDERMGRRKKNGSKKKKDTDVSGKPEQRQKSKRGPSAKATTNRAGSKKGKTPELRNDDGPLGNPCNLAHVVELSERPEIAGPFLEAADGPVTSCPPPVGEQPSISGKRQIVQKSKKGKPTANPHRTRSAAINTTSGQGDEDENLLQLPADKTRKSPFASLTVAGDSTGSLTKTSLRDTGQGLGNSPFQKYITRKRLSYSAYETSGNSSEDTAREEEASTSSPDLELVVRRNNIHGYHTRSGSVDNGHLNNAQQRTNQQTEKSPKQNEACGQKGKSKKKTINAKSPKPRLMSSKHKDQTENQTLQNSVMKQCVKFSEVNLSNPGENANASHGSLDGGISTQSNAGNTSPSTRSHARNISKPMQSKKKSQNARNVKGRMTSRLSKKCDEHLLSDADSEVTFVSLNLKNTKEMEPGERLVSETCKHGEATPTVGRRTVQNVSDDDKSVNSPDATVNFTNAEKSASEADRNSDSEIEEDDNLVILDNYSTDSRTTSGQVISKRRSASAVKSKEGHKSSPTSVAPVSKAANVNLSTRGQNSGLTGGKSSPPNALQKGSVGQTPRLSKKKKEQKTKSLQRSNQKNSPVMELKQIFLDSPFSSNSNSDDDEEVPSPRLSNRRDCLPRPCETDHASEVIDWVAAGYDCRTPVNANGQHLSDSRRLTAIGVSGPVIRCGKRRQTYEMEDNDAADKTLCNSSLSVTPPLTDESSPCEEIQISSIPKFPVPAELGAKTSRAVVNSDFSTTLHDTPCKRKAPNRKKSKKRVTISNFILPSPLGCEPNNGTPGTVGKSILKTPINGNCIQSGLDTPGNGSPVHIWEMTTSQTPQIHTEPPKPSKIILPKPGTPGLRRSRRTRIKPLQWYRNERPVYDRRKSGGLKIVDVSSPQGKPRAAPRNNKLKRKAMQVKKQQSQELKQRRLSAHVEPPDQMHMNDGKDVWVRDPERPDGEISLDCVRSLSSSEYWGPTGQKARETDPYIVCKFFQETKFGAGELVLRPREVKPTQTVSGCTMVLFILDGLLAVTIHETTFVLQTRDSFFIPPENTYSLENLRNTSAKLFFAQVKGA